MIRLIAGVLILLAAVGFLMLSKRESGGRRIIGGTAIVVGIATVILSTLTTIPAQNVGVVTSFGRPTGQTLSPGIHFKTPWHSVHDMDGTMQSIDNLGADHRTAVRLNNNSLMYVENAFRWKIRSDAAPALFLDWRKGGGNIVADNVGPGLVEKELAAAVNVALGGYDPLTPGAAGQTTDELAKKVTERIQSRIGDKITVESFTILRVDFDDATQARIVNYQEEVARTKAAEQRKKTAEAEAAANRELAASVSKDPNVLVSKCLDNERTMIEKGQPLPAGKSCWPAPAPQLVTPTS